jgi:hypothetical protein
VGAISTANSGESQPDANGPARLGPDNRENLQDRRTPAIQLDKEPAIMVREPNVTMQPNASRQSTDVAAQHSQPQVANST